MTDNQAHAKASDIPGWPCPPRVRDIPAQEESWGFVRLDLSVYPGSGSVAQDDLGYLWINGDRAPAYRLPTESSENPGCIAYWTLQGIGLWIHPKSLRFLPSISRLDMKPDEWLPVAAVAGDPPPFVKAAV
jgi:hypothetical protein